MEIPCFKVFSQVKESFIRTCLAWKCHLPANGHRAVLLPIWKSTQHVPAQSTKSHPVFIEIMGVVNVKGSDGGDTSYCVQGGLSLRGHRPYCDPISPQDPPWLAWFVSTRGTSAAAVQRSHYAHAPASPQRPKTQRSPGAEEPETALRETSIPFRRDQTARAEPRYFLLTIIHLRPSSDRKPFVRRRHPNLCSFSPLFFLVSHSDSVNTTHRPPSSSPFPLFSSVVYACAPTARRRI